MGTYTTLHTERGCSLRIFGIYLFCLCFFLGTRPGRTMAVLPRYIKNAGQRAGLHQRFNPLLPAFLNDYP